MQTAVAFVGSHSDYNFFSRFYSGLYTKEFMLTLLTCKPSLWIYARMQNIPCTFIKNSNNVHINQNVHATTEVCSKEVNEREATRFYNGVFECLEKLNGINNISFVLIWNGHSIPTKAMAAYAQGKKIPTLFFELSNIPQKIFVDPVGVNAKSLLFQKPEILSQFAVDEEQYLAWREKYLEYKRAESATPLAMKSQKVSNVLMPIDAVAARFFDIPVIGNMNILKKLNEFSKRNGIKFQYDAYAYTSGQYNFFPMQLSNDSQLVFNSGISSQEAITVAYEQSRKQGRDLLIKPHPLERNKVVFEFLSSIRSKENVYIVNNPTTQIVEYSQEIITINSTVGLEGLIAEKKVTFLGNSFYRQFNSERLRNYVLGYLIDIDYFSNTPLSDKNIEELLSRVSIR